MGRDADSPEIVSIAIDLPRDAVELILLLADALRASRGPASKIARELDATRKRLEKKRAAASQAEAEARREWQRLLSISLFRAWRRLPSPKTAAQRGEALRALAHEFSDLNGSLNQAFVDHMIRRRRSQVTSWLRSRRDQKVLRLYRLGLTRTAIAKHLGISIGTVDGSFRRNPRAAAELTPQHQTNRRLARLFLGKTAGLTNSEIGSRLGLHEKTVAARTRVIRLEIDHVSLARMASRFPVRGASR